MVEPDGKGVFVLLKQVWIEGGDAVAD